MAPVNTRRSRHPRSEKLRHPRRNRVRTVRSDVGRVGRADPPAQRPDHPVADSPPLLFGGAPVRKALLLVASVVPLVFRPPALAHKEAGDGGSPSAAPTVSNN